MGATAVHTLFSGQVKGCKVQQAVFVGGTRGPIHVESFNRNMKTVRVLESKWDPNRKKLVRRLLEEQDTVLRSYFAQKGGARSQGGDRVPWCHMARVGNMSRTSSSLRYVKIKRSAKTGEAYRFQARMIVRGFEM